MTLSKRKYKTITEGHRKACIWKIKDTLNDAEIARRLNITPQAVNKWWKLAHVKRELGDQDDDDGS